MWVIRRYQGYTEVVFTINLLICALVVIMYVNRYFAYVPLTFNTYSPM